MRQPPYRIALAARSVIYAPLFAAVRKLNKKYYRKHKALLWEFVVLKDSELGDRGAYNALGGRVPSAEVAVCDPMVVAEDADSIGRDMSGRDTHGVITSFLLCRPALWVLSTPRAKGRFKRGHHELKGTLPYHSRNVRNAPMGNVATYCNCTAWMILDFASRGLRPYWKTKKYLTIKPGDERGLISNSAERAPKSEASMQATGDDDRPDHVITWDGLLAAEFRPRKGTEGDYRHVFAWHCSSIVPDFPFTAIVCARMWLRHLSVMRHVRLLQKEMRAAIASIHSRKDEITDAAMEQFAAIYDTSLLDDNGFLREGHKPTDDFKEHFKRCLEDLRGNKTDTERVVTAYPADICPDWSILWIRNGWVFSATELWDLVRHKSLDEVRSGFESCSTTLLAPRGWWHRVLAYQWNARNRIKTLNAIIAAFIGALLIAVIVAWIEHASRLPDLVSTTTAPASQSTGVLFETIKSLWFVPDSLATGIALLAWAFVIFPLLSGIRAIWRLLSPRHVEKS